MFPYHVIQPPSAAPLLISALAYPMHVQFLKHNSLHASNPKLMFTRAVDVSGTLARANSMNPSPTSHICVPTFLLHPLEPSLRYQSCGDCGSYPGRQPHSKVPDLYGSQKPKGPQWL
ncbi:hypothetical protein HanPI659440_Chr00c13g0726441 [Helianthus annuus]|nr:hypothetical protein HanPI659440_Chr00c13g0726441 [Helianthus annuus]